MGKQSVFTGKKGRASALYFIANINTTLRQKDVHGLKCMDFSNNIRPYNSKDHLFDEICDHNYNTQAMREPQLLFDQYV